MGTYNRSYSFADGEIPTETEWNVDIDGIIALLNGGLDDANVDYTSADGIVTMARTQTISGAKTFTAASQFSSTVTVGVDGTGYDVQFFGATSGAYMLWDESADKLIITGDFSVSGTVSDLGTVTTADINGGTIDGATIGGASAGAGTFTTLTASGLTTATGGIQSGGNIVSDTDSTDDLGTTGVRWANLYVDDITLTTTITAGTSVVANTMTLSTGSIVDSTGAISFGDENLSTTGTLDAGATTVTSLTTGGSIVSDTTNTDDIGTSSVLFRTGYFQCGWQNPFRIGACRLWEDTANGRLMYKYNSNPASETDGNEFMVG